MGPQDHHHRSSWLKQKNKEHKHGKYKSKGEMDEMMKGKVTKGALGHKNRHETNKMQRKNRAKQLREMKRAELVAQHRRIGGSSGAPQVVGIVPLCSDSNVRSVRQVLQRACMEGADPEISTQIESQINQDGPITCVAQRLKTRMTILEAPRDVLGVLDVVKAADVVVFVVSCEESPDEFGDLALSCCKALGLPAIAFVAQGLESIPGKRKAEVKKALLKYVTFNFPEEEKVFGVDTENEGIVLLRHLSTKRREHASWREIHPFLLADTVNYVPADQEKGTLEVTGYLRGANMNPNWLVHVPNCGDFQIEKIMAETDPNPLTKRKQKSDDSDMQGTEPQVIGAPDPEKQESLQSELEPDPMDAEQVHPTEEEMMAGEERMAALQRKPKIKRVPKGTSSYQAAWIVEEDLDDDEEDLTDVDEAGSDDDRMSMYSYAGSGGEEEEFDVSDTEYEEIVEGEAEDKNYDDQMDYEKDAQERAELKKAREAEDLEFPDEMDTPVDMPARIRFQKFRGLESFRTSPWDPKESLPYDYARIFQFENMKLTQRRVKDDVKEGVQVGQYVKILIKDFPAASMELVRKTSPLVLAGLLRHENKMSVLNMAIRRHQANEEPIRSKEQLVFVTPMRRFQAGAVFSQHTRGDKHKFERFLHLARPTVATVYAPVHFSPCPVLVFKQDEGELRLVATGSVLSVDPDRIVLKRYMLSGHPYKINIKTAVIRFMFYSRADIEWFKPIELHTKHGLRGHIKEPLGTHGHMKCSFNGKMRSDDTVCMNLYKRVYPKWNYSLHVHIPKISTGGVMSAAAGNGGRALLGGENGGDAMDM
eukprot:comp22240_c0_seq1/m.32807 comp22240_c0_seq1/g.32807  ORF comp22240_c0_seq1/g.32807 comp22240_c0_seq1/m.32807 type:complete len:819 (-) comp22240_c0_seq1:143-2599(-)